jgi:hypothetical protein
MRGKAGMLSGDSPENFMDELRFGNQSGMHGQQAGISVKKRREHCSPRNCVPMLCPPFACAVESGDRTHVGSISPLSRGDRLS